METYEKKSAFDKLKDYCQFAKENDYIEVTLWYNGEGFDVDMNSTKEQLFRLTWGEYAALKKLVKRLDG